MYVYILLYFVRGDADAMGRVPGDRDARDGTTHATQRTTHTHAHATRH